MPESFNILRETLGFCIKVSSVDVNQDGFDGPLDHRDWKINRPHQLGCSGAEGGVKVLVFLSETVFFRNKNGTGV